MYLLHLTPTGLLHWSTGLVGIDGKHEVKHTSFPVQFKSLLNHVIFLEITDDDISNVEFPDTSSLYN